MQSLQAFLVLLFLLLPEKVFSVNEKYNIRPELDLTKYFLFGGVKDDKPIYDNDVNVDQFAYYEIYRYDAPIPMGLPVGFFTQKGRGRPVGLLAYMVNFKSPFWMWNYYYNVNL